MVGAARRAASLYSETLRSWPILLFLLAGTLGVVVAGRAGRGPALREWRWLIVEPLLFYLLVRFHGRGPVFRRRLLWTWLLTGAALALIGLLQLAGLDLADIIRDQKCFSEAVVPAGGVSRATSVYCHPNNLGLALGRIWPLAAAIAFGSGLLPQWRNGKTLLRTDAAARGAGVAALVALLILAGLAASFSKGAFIGAFAALVVLGLLLRRRLLVGIALVAAVAVLAGGLLVGLERLNPLGGSSGARLELWGSALAMLRDHPFFGVGLDQFFRLRRESGPGPYISAEAFNNSEGFAAHPHNLVLDTLLRIGPLGLIALSALVIVFFIRARFVLRHGDRRACVVTAGLVAGMIAALVHGLVDNFYFVADLAIVFWLQIALVDLEWRELLHSADDARHIGS